MNLDEIMFLVEMSTIVVAVKLWVENEHYFINNWLNLISSSTVIPQQFSPEVGKVIVHVDRWEFMTFLFLDHLSCL